MLCLFFVFMITCEDCNAKCCRYVAVDMDEPDCLDDWDQIKWLLMHENVRVYLDNDGDWIVEFITKCKNLGKDNRCKIYDRRPDLCRDHNMSECVMNGEGEVEVLLFETPEQVDEYLKKKGLDKSLPKVSPDDD
ncbi:YkgJ family cysteine cluster protein [Candidatus Woesearchaeota archaeon]|nr:YkgJ family cysteine cluster protein [Candidatus Woesearchaeota archaeon]